MLKKELSHLERQNSENEPNSIKPSRRIFELYFLDAEDSEFYWLISGLTLNMIFFPSEYKESLGRKDVGEKKMSWW